MLTSAKGGLKPPLCVERHGTVMERNGTAVERPFGSTMGVVTFHSVPFRSTAVATVFRWCGYGMSIVRRVFVCIVNDAVWLARVCCVWRGVAPVAAVPRLFHSIPSVAAAFR